MVWTCSWMMSFSINGRVKYAGKREGKVRASCLIYGSESRPMKVEQKIKLDEMSMIGELLELENVSLVIKRGGIKWFGGVEIKKQW